jgi:nucleotide-binding universal stress UspA family protein
LRIINNNQNKTFKLKKLEIHIMIKNQIRRILVPMDGSKTSQKALDQAIEVARATHATILGLNIIPFLPAEFMPAVSPYKIYQRKEAGLFLEKAKYRAAKHGILFSYAILYGSPVEQIMAIAKRKKIDLIVIGARGKGRVKELFLGSVSNAVLHKSQIPVLLVK